MSGVHFDFATDSHAHDAALGAQCPERGHTAARPLRPTSAINFPDAPESGPASTEDETPMRIEFQ